MCWYKKRLEKKKKVFHIMRSNMHHMQDCIYMKGLVITNQHKIAMVQKETSFGKMEKERGGRMLLFATQTLCAFFLFHLLYIELFTFKPTWSEQIKRKF